MTTTPTSAGALVPFTETFVQTSASTTLTTAIALVGQVLDNAQTNFVGYDNGSAEYLFTTSRAGASETTLDGETYYVSAGVAPAGYLLVSGSTTGSGSATSTESGAGAASTAVSSGSSAMSKGAGSSSKTSSASASSTSSSGGVEVSVGAALTVAVGLLAVVVNVFA